MTNEIIDFGKRMDAAEDKAMLVDYAEFATRVLDLGAGTGKISRDIAEKWGAHVDAVDIQFKDNCQNSELVTYYGMSISNFLKTYKDNKYDCIVLSAILHELNSDELATLAAYLQHMMLPNCRILIREPFYDQVLGPVLVSDAEKFVELVSSNIKASKALEFIRTSKLSGQKDFNSFGTATDWANLAFTISYGEQSWEREKHEYRYARSLDWCKRYFNFDERPFTGFQLIPVFDETYSKHFEKAGIPKEAFDMIQYTGMLIIIDYSI